MLAQQIKKQSETIDSLRRSVDESSQTINGLLRTIDELNQTIKDLTEKLGMNSRNSSKPPSSCFRPHLNSSLISRPEQLQINTVLGFFVFPEYEGRGIGRGLFSELLKNAEYPIYVHTHPIASSAIKLYSDFGFKFITDPVVGYRENNLKDSLPYLKEVLPARDLHAC